MLLGCCREVGSRHGQKWMSGARESFASTRQALRPNVRVYLYVMRTSGEIILCQLLGDTIKRLPPVLFLFVFVIEK